MAKRGGDCLSVAETDADDDEITWPHTIHEAQSSADNSSCDCKRWCCPDTLRCSSTRHATAVIHLPTPRGRKMESLFFYQIHFISLHFKDSRTSISCTHPVPHHIVTEFRPVLVSIPPPPFHRNAHSSHFRQYSPLLWFWQILDNFWQFLAECYLKSVTDWFIFLSYFKSQLLGRRLNGTWQVTGCKSVQIWASSGSAAPTTY